MINDTQSFTIKANKVHSNKYDYSLVEYKNHKTKVKIICPKHGEFEQIAIYHTSGNGCPICANDFLGNNTQSFVIKANKVHNNKYDYSLVEYKNYKIKIKIICPKHGEFEQTPRSHLNGYGCKLCGIEKLKHNTQSFVEKANKVHNNKYDYSLVKYKNSYSKVKIICPKHGEFEQRPNSHLSLKEGCPRCSVNISKIHNKLYNHICNFIDVTINDRSIIKPYEIDIFVPDCRLGIEINGLYWHSYDHKESHIEKYKHYNKYELCKENNIRLIQINEDEMIGKEDIIKSVIESKLGISKRIYARKCKIIDLNNEQYREFINKYHLQEHKTASIKYGLEYDTKLVAVMSFNKHPKYQWEITRFANKLGITVVGGASKLFKHFLKKHNPNQVLTYADRRYSNGNLYKKLGFKLDGITQPNYKYVKGYKIFSRQQFQKHKLKNKLESFDPNLTEAENMFNNGYRRMWDAGNYKFYLER